MVWGDWNLVIEPKFGAGEQSPRQFSQGYRPVGAFFEKLSDRRLFFRSRRAAQDCKIQLVRRSARFRLFLGTSDHIPRRRLEPGFEDAAIAEEVKEIVRFEMIAGAKEFLLRVPVEVEAVISDAWLKK